MLHPFYPELKFAFLQQFRVPLGARLLVALLLVLPLSSRAQVELGRWQFNSNTCANPQRAASSVVAGLEFSEFTLGAGLNCENQNNRQRAENWPTSSTWNNDDYYSFTITAEPCSSLALDNLQFTEYRSGNGPTKVMVVFSVDGGSFSPPLSEWNPPTSSGTRTIDLSSRTDLQDLRAQEVEFRLYGADAGASGGIYVVDNVRFNGVVNAEDDSPPLANSTVPVCASHTATVSVVPCGTTVIDWYAEPTGGSPLATNTNSYTTGPLSDDDTLWAQALAPGFGTYVASIRKPVPVSVVTDLGNNTITNTGQASYCSSDDPGVLSGSLPTGGSNDFDGDYTYLWEYRGPSAGSFSPAPGTNDQQDYDPSPLSAGGVHRFRRVVNDSWAPCSPAITSNEISITVTEVQASASATDETCVGVDDGSIDLTVSGGDSPYTYAWSGPMSYSNTVDEDPSGLADGVYDVTVTDDNGCTATASATVNAGAANPTANAVATDEICNGADDGSIDLSVSGGSTPYSYAWTGPNSYSNTVDEDPSGLADGAYDVTVTDDNGCIGTASATVNAGATVSASASATDEICDGADDGSIDLTVSGGATPYTYDWTGPMFYTNTVDEDPSGLADGAYDVTVTDDNGCTATASATVNAGATVSASATTTDETCVGADDGSIDLTVSGGASPYTYDWTGPNSYTSNQEDLTGLEPGGYALTVTDDNGCQAIIAPMVNPAPPIDLISNSSNTNCSAPTGTGSITVTAVGGTSPYTYAWNTGGNSPAINGLAAGQYDVLVTDAQGCELRDTFFVTNGDDPGQAVSQTASDEGYWLAYRYQGNRLAPSTFRGLDTLFTGLNFTESFTASSTEQIAIGCPLNINGNWGTRYRRTETLQEGFYRVRWQADRYARFSLDGGANWTITTPSADQLLYKNTTGPTDLVVEYRDNDGAPTNSIDFQLEYMGVDDMEYSDDQQWTVFYYQGGGLGPQDVIGVDTAAYTATNEIVLDWDLIARGASGGEYEPNFGFPIDLNSPYRIIFRREVQMVPDQYDVVVDAYGDRLRWAWDGSRYWNWISSMNAPNTPWGQSSMPYDFAANVENDGVGNHRTVVNITPSGNKVAQPDSSGILGLQPVQLTLYPNPAQNSFQVELSQAVAGDIQLSLLDVQGKAFLQKTFTGEALRRLPLELPARVTPGVYLVQVQGAGLNETLRLVVGR